MTEEELIPPDRERCQAYVPNKTWSPFNLGPANADAQGRKSGGSVHNDRLYRCVEKTDVIVRELASEDGVLGEMGLCANCLVQLMTQEPGRAEVIEIIGGVPIPK